MSNDNFVIVGGGLAAATAAETLRDEGFEGTVRLFAEESHVPYSRPPLSKEYFTGKAERDSVFVHPAHWYDERNIDVEISSKVVGLDVAAHSITLADDRTASFDRLLLATGASPRHLTIDGADGDGVYYLRTLEQSERLKGVLANGSRNVVIIGAGWIGLEIASAAREYGNSVTVIGRETVPLQAALGDELGGVFRELHEAHAVKFRLGASIQSIERIDGELAGVVTDTGTVPADIVVVGVGAIPNTALAEAAGLTIDNGLLVDERLVSSAPDILGAGDLANAFHPVVKRHLRNEHWANAIATGKLAARSMLGQSVVFDEIPYFYTDQFDLGMEYSGYGALAADARVVYRGDKENREFIAFWLANDRVVAGMNVNVWDVNEQVQRLIRSQAVIDPARLSDRNIDLSEV